METPAIAVHRYPGGASVAAVQCGHWPLAIRIHHILTKVRTRPQELPVEAVHYPESHQKDFVVVTPSDGLDNATVVTDYIQDTFLKRYVTRMLYLDTFLTMRYKKQWKSVMSNRIKKHANWVADKKRKLEEEGVPPRELPPASPANSVGETPRKKTHGVECEEGRRERRGQLLQEMLCQLKEQLGEKGVQECIFRVECSPRSEYQLNVIDLLLDNGFKLNPSSPTHILSVLIPAPSVIAMLPKDEDDGLGVESLAFGIRPLSAAFRYVSIPPDTLCHAQAKLSEALWQAGIDLKPDWNALDLGAAPGGWTLHLSKHVKQVVAIDPAKMDFKGETPSNVVHIQGKAEEHVEEVRSRFPPFDILTCDMNGDQRAHARLMAQVAKEVGKPGAVVVFTMKSPRRMAKEGQEAQWNLDPDLMASLKELLVKEVLRDDPPPLVTWLMANTIHERTIVGYLK